MHWSHMLTDHDVAIGLYSNNPYVARIKLYVQQMPSTWAGRRKIRISSRGVDLSSPRGPHKDSKRANPGGLNIIPPKATQEQRSGRDETRTSSWERDVFRRSGRDFDTRREWNKNKGLPSAQAYARKLLTSVSTEKAGNIYFPRAHDLARVCITALPQRW